MKPVNLFRVSRIRDERLFNIMEKHEASDHDNHRIRIHEIDSLRILTDALAGQGIKVRDTDGFYFGFVIPLVGKEFDLVKVTNKYCLNIELKSQDVGEDQILAQLRKNRHYLTLLGRDLMLFTVVTDTLACYRLTDDNELEPTDISEIAKAVRKCRAAYHGNIVKLFRASEYLISPEENPDKFLQGQYFLSPAQDYVKAELLRDIASTSYCAFFHIYGRPCTGKTLLIYDLAKHLSGSGRTLITCGEEPGGGLISISESIENLDFISVSDIVSSDRISGYDFILVDEALRIDPVTFDIIINAAETYEQVCIFSTDPSAVLTDPEQENDIAGRIHSLGLAGEYELSERLRLNMEIQTFLRKLKHLECKTEKNYEFEHISVNYANNADEARKIINYYRKKGYVFINAHRHSDDPFADLEESFRHRHIAGREYNSVVMLMDSSFEYDDAGYLMGIPKPDPAQPYPNIFYPGITRVREHLALVILDAPELLSNILSIFD
ncbi:MAG: hypothetical protein IKG17_04750 [Mogibacterium sp.]|nr:hypothetical protein [Mogibacterium sp.]